MNSAGPPVTGKVFYLHLGEINVTFFGPIVCWLLTSIGILGIVVKQQYNIVLLNAPYNPDGVINTYCPLEGVANHHHFTKVDRFLVRQ